ncbi:MAG: glycosyltransferase family 4 protein [Phycisphaerales bacterium]|nr:glycosyltransferase family 4 protein [Phycisphaerales bacterium]
MPTTNHIGTEAAKSGHPASVQSDNGRDRLPLVYIWQPSVFHYRVPVFDELRALGVSTNSYDLRVLGTLEPGNKAVGGDHRDYFIESREVSTTRAGIMWLHWEKWKEIIDRDRPDVVIIQANLRSLSSWKIPTYCRKLGIPCYGWGKINSFSKLAVVSNAVKPYFFKRFLGMVVYSQASKRELAAAGYPESKIIVAQNTIDTRRIYSSASQIKARAAELRAQHGLDGKIILQCIGRMDPEKRHADLLDAWPRLRELDPRLVLVLVSGGPLLKDIKARANALDPERIVVTGRVPEGDDYSWIAAADICIYPGAVGLAINQGLALAKPTIIADEWGADGELIEHGKTGYRYQRANLAELVKAVDHVLKNPEETARIGESTRALIRDHVTIENYVSRLDEVVRRGLAARKGVARR